MQSSSATFLTPYKLCKCLLIKYFVEKKTSTIVKRKLGGFLLKEIKSTQCEREQSWNELCSSLEKSIAPHHREIISWLLEQVIKNFKIQFDLKFNENYFCDFIFFYKISWTPLNHQTMSRIL